jgi:hypothetical protein
LKHEFLGVSLDGLTKKEQAKLQWLRNMMKFECINSRIFELPMHLGVCSHFNISPEMTGPAWTTAKATTGGKQRHFRIKNNVFLQPTSFAGTTDEITSCLANAQAGSALRMSVENNCKLCSSACVFFGGLIFKFLPAGHVVDNTTRGGGWGPSTLLPLAVFITDVLSYAAFLLYFEAVAVDRTKIWGFFEKVWVGKSPWTTRFCLFGIFTHCSMTVVFDRNLLAFCTD